MTLQGINTPTTAHQTSERKHAWQEHRRTLPLAEFPTEMFDPRSTLLNNHEHKVARCSFIFRLFFILSFCR